VIVGCPRDGSQRLSRVRNAGDIMKRVETLIVGAGQAGLAM